jgi:hypothetical protein
MEPAVTTAACYGIHQLQLWFPETSSALADMTVGALLYFRHFSGRGNHRGDADSAQCRFRVLPLKEILIWHLAP